MDEDERQHARERIGNETTSGSEIEFADGTKTIDGRVVKVGSLAIVEGDQIIGWKQADAG